jgi:modulator of FtsH protease
MESGYQFELWRDLFVVLGSSAAALIGLLFIAISLHLNDIVNNPIARRRAFNNTCFLLIILIEALLFLIPQPMPILGAELIFINLLGFWLPFRVASSFFKERERYRDAGGRIYRPLIFSAGSLAGIAGGAALIAHSVWGAYLVGASCIVFLVFVVFGAWSIMIGIGQAEKTKMTM